jgi:hypothetical protein
MPWGIVSSQAGWSTKNMGKSKKKRVMAGGRFAQVGTLSALSPKGSSSLETRAAALDRLAQRGVPAKATTATAVSILQRQKLENIAKMYSGVRPTPNTWFSDFESAEIPRIATPMPQSFSEYALRYAGSALAPVHARLSEEELDKLVANALKYEETLASINEAATQSAEATMQLVQEQIQKADIMVRRMMAITRSAIEVADETLRNHPQDNCNKCTAMKMVQVALKEFAEEFDLQ